MNKLAFCHECEEYFVPQEHGMCPEGHEDWEMADTTMEDFDEFNSDAEADADALRSAGWGTDEDYGFMDERY
jgi:hypothetical protein